ncbi:MAG TPA: HD-GYP domain-containing protein [Rhodocyclaceae bacterium]|nr:HD-GYP domain-containing protein [Rhodocyclaceae bacterium]
MLKKIAIQHLRRGMYIQEFCASWMEHPFWRSAFLLRDPKDFTRILESGISELWIDTSKGLDVEAGQTKEAADAEVAEELSRVAEEPPSEPPQPQVSVERVAIGQELVLARKTVERAKTAVASMFQEVRMGKALDANEALPVVEEIASSVSRNPGALISLVRLKNKNEYTYMHSVAVCALMVALARQLGLDEKQTREAGLAGLLHDLGKMMIPAEILDKPGKLTDEEFGVIKSHPEEGYKLLLEGRNVSEAVMDVCIHHHEKVDGTGYPHRLTDDQISLFAKMGAVCDVYDAITSDRPYKAGWAPAESLRKMAMWATGHFDQRVFHAFIKSVGIYPIGSLVRLESGRLGVVVDQAAQSLLSPRVKVFFSTKANIRIPHEVLDLDQLGAKDKIVAHEDAAKWGFHNLNEIWGGAAGG